MNEEEQLLLNIDLSFQRAAGLMELSDFAHLDEETDESLEAAEVRFHCGTCIVRTVLEEVWPEVEKLIDYWKDQALGQDGTVD